MSFSFLGSLAGLLPGYLQGQRMANQDNWQDLMNYNQAQQGQLSNAFTSATWQPRLDMYRDSAVKSNLDMNGALMDFRTKMLYQPYMEQNAFWQSYYGMPLAQAGALANLQLARQANLGQAVRGTIPSNIGGGYYGGTIR